MRMTELALIEYIKKMVKEQVAPEDQKDFVDTLKCHLEEKIFLSDIDIEKKYGDLLHQLLDKVTEADETEGINPHLIAAGVGNAFLDR